MNEGWQPDRCAACGHASGEHKSGGTRFPHPPRRGICLASTCECREYVREADLEGGDHAA